MIELEENTEQEKEETKTVEKEELKVNTMVDVPLESVEVEMASDNHDEVESNDTDTIITHENVQLSAKLDKLNEVVA